VRDVPGRKVLLQREGRGQKVELIEFFASLPQGRRELVPFPQLLFEIGVKMLSMTRRAEAMGAIRSYTAAKKASSSPGA